MEGNGVIDFVSEVGREPRGFASIERCNDRTYQSEAMNESYKDGDDDHQQGQIRQQPTAINQKS